MRQLCLGIEARMVAAVAAIISLSFPQGCKSVYFLEVEIAIAAASSVARRETHVFANALEHAGTR